jgi:hypothetical protein
VPDKSIRIKYTAFFKNILHLNMAACKFSVSFSGPAEGVIAKAKNAVQNQGGQFTGDSNSGTFHVSVFGNTIEGNYSIAENNMHIEILSKPFLLPCSAIEGFLKSQLGG